MTLSVKNDVNGNTVSKKIIFVAILKITDEKSKIRSRIR